MFSNEIILIFHSIIISIFSVLALRVGKEALIAILCVQAILSNLFVSKQIILFGLCATCSDAFSVGSGLALNLLQEYYGKAIARKTIWISFFTLIFYLMMTQIHLTYLRSSFDTTHEFYYQIFNTMPRIVIASLISYFISQQIDTRVYAYLKKRFEGRYFLLRNYGSLLISQFVDTLLFSILGLHGIVENTLHIFLFSYAMKCLTIFIEIPIVVFCKRYIKLGQNSFVSSTR